MKIRAIVVLVLLAVAIVGAFWLAGERTTHEPSSPVRAEPERKEAESTDERRRERSVDEAAPTTDEATSGTDPVDERATWPVRVVTNVPGAEVSVTFRYPCGDPDPPPDTKVADATGFAGFALPKRDDAVAGCTAVARAPEYATAREDFEVGEVRIELKPGFAVSGHVFDDARRPVEGVDVTGIGAHAATGADGSFEAFAPTRGPFSPHFERSDFLPRNVPVTAPASDLVVMLERGLSISGRVTFPDLRPVPGVTIRDGGGRHRSVTDEEGRYVVSGLSPGSFELTCALTGESRTFDAGAVGVDFVIDVPVARLRLVDEARRPIRRASLWIRILENGEDDYVSAGAAGAGGIEMVPGAPGARFFVVPSAAGFDDRVTSLTFGTEPRLQDVEIVMTRGAERGTIRLTVRDDAGGVPAPVFVTVEDEAGSPASGWYAKRVELAAGMPLEISGLVPSRYDVVVTTSPRFSAEGYHVATRAGVVVEAGRAAELDVTLAVGGRVRVTMRDESGTAVTPKRLDLLKATGERVQMVFINKTADGGWTSRLDATPSVFGAALAPGRYVIVGTGPAGDVVRKDVVVERGVTTDVEIVVATK